MAQALPNVRNDRGTDLSPRGAAVREFAALEFPREDFRWIASQVRPVPARTGGFRARWDRFRRSIGSPRETETEADPVPDPGAA